MFVTYMTTYSEDKLPALYIGSSTAKRVALGYRGSARRDAETARKALKTATGS